MIVKTILTSGLGNQLFMIFACISYALDNNRKFVFLSKINKTTSGTNTYWNNVFFKLRDYIDENYENIDKNLVYNEPCFEYKPIPVVDKEIILSGYFQSYKYFRYNYDKIMDILGIQKLRSDVYNRHISLFKNDKTIALHFRFGDYLALQHLHCIKGPDYYVFAIIELEKQLKKRDESIKDYTVLYFVESGFQKFVDEYLQIICNNTSLSLNNFEKVPDDIDDWKQMFIMSCCNHFIIANSSFSWFGAYLCDKKDKIVCRPNIWFGPANSTKNINDLCPDNWITIMR